MELNKIHNIDALKGLKQLDSESVDCVMTSPPYWALRDYGVEGQLGLEPTFQEYIKKLCDIFDEVKRVLKKSGTCWVNLGDTYYGSGKGAGGDITNSKQVWAFENKESKICANCGKSFEGYKFQSFCGSACSGVDNTPREFRDAIEWKRKSRDEYNKVGIKKECLYCGKKIKGKPNSQFCSRECLNKLGNEFRGQRRLMPDKCLTQIPSRFAIEMCNRGWILRNEIIWYKKNCMPSSAKDRFTVDFEKIFFFVKNKKYWFETQREGNNVSFMDNVRVRDVVKNRIKSHMVRASKEEVNNYDSKGVECVGRNKRTVWQINPKPFPEAHFAVYPEELCQTPINSGCPEFVCVKCGKAKIKNWKFKKQYMKYPGGVPTPIEEPQNTNQRMEHYFKDRWKMIAEKYDWISCSCKVGFKGGVVLDPFIGAGTTGVVAKRLGRQFIGFEINPEYVKIANRRLGEVELPLTQYVA